MRPVDLAVEHRARLEDQAGFLRVSLRAFFAGYQAEALRIATTLRVLVHDKPAAPCLLRQVDANYNELGLLDRASGMPGAIDAARAGNLAMLIPIPMVLGSTQTEFEIVEGPSYPRIPLPLWWREVPTLVLGDEELPGPRTLVREGLVKLLANKEGGAHVAPDGPDGAPAYYRRLILERPVRVRSQGMEDSRNAAYWVVAQSGAEMLEALARRYSL